MAILRADVARQARREVNKAAAAEISRLKTALAEIERTVAHATPDTYAEALVLIRQRALEQR